jgi:hypothetical protein
MTGDIMTKFYGKVGYVTSKQVSPGVFEDDVVERTYRGDILQNSRRWETTDNLNDNLVIANQISIIGDVFAYANLETIKYVIWQGVKWKVSTIEIARPRLILKLGEVYNG